jgi:hypothetical protein
MADIADMYNHTYLILYHYKVPGVPRGLMVLMDILVIRDL